jgi:uncharacterized SAM-binding protein YcdF (DUF218 family)
MRASQRGGIFFKLILLLVLLALMALGYLLRRPLLRAAGECWVVDDGVGKADAIVVLSDDNYYADRAAHAAELYHARWAPRIVASGRMLRRHAGIAELMQRDLTERGVPADAVVGLPHTADSTREEAQVVQQLVAERGWHRILVVTSNYHTRRTRYIYRRVFPAAMEVRVVPARDSRYDSEHWWESRQGVKLFFYEAVAFPLAIWELRHARPQPTAAPKVAWAVAPLLKTVQGVVFRPRHSGPLLATNSGLHAAQPVIYSRVSRPLPRYAWTCPQLRRLRRFLQGGFRVAQAGRTQAIFTRAGSSGLASTRATA